jgi:hypothetical protein
MKGKYIKRAEGIKVILVLKKIKKKSKRIIKIKWVAKLYWYQKNRDFKIN